MAVAAAVATAVAVALAVDAAVVVAVSAAGVAAAACGAAVEEGLERSCGFPRASDGDREGSTGGGAPLLALQGGWVREGVVMSLKSATREARSPMAWFTLARKSDG